MLKETAVNREDKIRKYIYQMITKYRVEICHLSNITTNVLLWRGMWRASE